MDLAATVGNVNALRFIRSKMERQEISSIEAAQALLVFFHFGNASEEVVEEAMVKIQIALESYAYSPLSDRTFF